MKKTIWFSLIDVNVNRDNKVSLGLEIGTSTSSAFRFMTNFSRIMAKEPECRLIIQVGKKTRQIFTDINSCQTTYLHGTCFEGLVH